MADELKIPSFSKQKKLKSKSVTIQAPLPSMGTNTPNVGTEEEPQSPPNIISTTKPSQQSSFVSITDEQIESCRKGQDIFDFARDIEELVRINNKI